MLTIIHNSLPSGLAKMEIGDVVWTQRSQYPCIERSKTIKTPPKNVSKKIVDRVRTPQIPSPITQLLPHIDEMFALYSNDMKADLERSFVDKLRVFVGSAPGRDLISHKQARDVMVYMNNTRRDPPDGFFLICSFLLDASIHVEGKTFTFEGTAVTQSIDIKLSKK